jgi:high-affinity iron transporter
MSRGIVRALLALTTLVALLAGRQALANDAATVWRLLDYVAVDYQGAVSNGRVASEAEYAEMVEFSATIRSRIGALPATTARPALLSQAEGLQRAVAEKAAPNDVAARARSLAGALLTAYPMAQAPTRAPDPQRGAALYAQNCASCHGSDGNGHGPAAANLNPPPIAFADLGRARQRSLFGLYQVIDQGLDGTAMASFSNLPVEDRWALAFHVGSIAFRNAQEGERLWRGEPALRQRFPNLAALTSITPAALSREIGEAKADALTAYLRTHSAVIAANSGSLALSRQRLNEALDAYRAGDRQRAEELALSAYLDGFEPLEPILASRNSDLMAHIERAMGELRAAIIRAQPIPAVAERVAALDGLFDEAEAVLSPDASSDTSTFVGAFTILLREGLEALLVIIAMIAFLRKADREDALPYVHGGWVAALLAGVLTWVAATYLIGISGASRELTEGFGSIIAAIVLLTVGIWMHGKSQADEWQRYIREKLGKALSRGSAWFLFGLSFLVVYREVFETILFYAALWTQGNGAIILAGIAAGVTSLGIIGWILLRYSRRLPIGKFFAYSSALVAVLTVVLAGKGIAALQEAGLIDVSPLEHFPRITMLGMFPSAQVVAAQLVALAAIVIGFWLNSRRAAARAGPEAT